MDRVEGKFFARGCQASLKKGGAVPGKRVKMVRDGLERDAKNWEWVESEEVCEELEQEAMDWQEDVRRLCGWRIRWAAVGKAGGRWGRRD